MPEFEVSRREFLKLAVVELTGLWVAAHLPNVAEAQPLKPWSTRQWFPFDARLAVREGIMTLFQPEGPLDIHDQWHQYEFGYRSHAREWEEELAHRVLRESPEASSWSGRCNAVANANLLEPEPQAGRFSRFIKEGLLAALHAADTYDPPMTNPAIVGSIIQRGARVVVDLPEKPGKWFRVAYAVDGDRVLVTNLGYPDKWMPLSGIVSAYIPKPIEAYDSSGREPYAMENPELNRDLAYWMISQ